MSFAVLSRFISQMLIASFQKEFDVNADHTNPTGLRSDGTTLWVADGGDDKLYAYHLK